MNFILFDTDTWENILPLTFTRPVCEIRIGILTIKEKWDKMLNQTCSYLTQPYLAEKYQTKTTDTNHYINGGILPNQHLIDEIKQLKPNDILVSGNDVVACCTNENFDWKNIDSYKTIECKSEFDQINYPWDIFSKNGDAIQSDFDLITEERTSEELSHTNRIIGTGKIFLEPGAVVECAILNTTDGPIYVGCDAEIMEGSVVRGPLALCEHSALKLSTKIYGPTTIGPNSKVGGELNNCVIFGYTNKAHDGFLGNSVIGEWCNLGADTNNSNLKNNYAEVRLWNYQQEKFTKTGLQFCGLIMGDHSKCGINTMFNTGTVVGVSANIFGSGFPRNFIPSYSWGGAHGFEIYMLKKVFEVAEKVMARRKIEFTETDKKIMTTIFEMTEKFRKF